MKKFIYQYQPNFDSKEAQSLYDYIMNGGWCTEYKKTNYFENMLSEFIGVRHCIAVNNGTVALAVSLMALGLSKGDEVIVPNLTMIATANAVLLAGGKPVLVDIEPETLCLDLNKALEAITEKTKAIIYVSLNGRSGNLYKVRTLCEKQGLYLIEDAAQSLGSNYKGKRLGSFGHLGCFSFSPHKIVSTGQGGAIVTNYSILAKRIRRLKDFGRIKGGIDIHPRLGFNFKFTDIQAVVGIEQIKRLPERIRRKKEIFELYYHELNKIRGIRFIPTDLSNVNPWFVDIYLKNPNQLASFLMENNIATRRVYPPISKQKVYNLKKKFPVSEKFSRQGIWLPSSIILKNEEITYICRKIRQFLTQEQR